MIKLNIVSPIGGFGNHVRWLMLLDNQFNFNIIIDRKDDYINMSGPDWPSYDDYINGYYHNVTDNILNEIKLEFVITKFSSLPLKINFIKQKVYSVQRSYHNWLHIEWQYRRLLDNFIQIIHPENKNDWKSIAIPTLVLTIDPFLAYKCYVKFNSNLNNTTKDDFIQSLESINQENISLSNSKENIEIMDSAILYQSGLDYDWYQQLISKFNLDDNYESANIIHRLWYEGHKRSERDILTDMTLLFGSNETDRC